MSENKASKVGNESTEECDVSLLDALKMEKDMEKQYAAVYGASDEESCTYSKGYIKRQALYACLTCCPEARTDETKCAGICLACSNKCHENHDLVELYTKRNFRCDCPTERIPGIKCSLNSNYDMIVDGKKFPKNINNLYNHNFWGLYCVCERPYPDPENSNEEDMLQCEICEDWYHMRHLNVESDIPLTDNDYEMICGGCMTTYKFLQDYAGLAVKIMGNELENVSGSSTSGSADISVCDDKLKSDLDKSITEIMNISSVEENENVSKLIEEKNDLDANTAKRPAEHDNEDVGETESKRMKLDVEEKAATSTPAPVGCSRPKIKSDWKKGAATFFPNDWRSSLCKCSVCFSIYETNKIAFLLDNEDSVKNYEERGINQLAALESKAFEQCARAFSSIGRAQQIDAIIEYNRFKEKLTEFLQSFVANNKVVTEADVNQFFQEMRNTRNSNIGQPYFCR